ncbi:tetratricopeptide repeat protein [Leptolyngbyaceae cyanobacterium UHCC 1019]
MNESMISALLEELRNSDEAIRDRATRELWQIWFEQKGAIGLEVLRRAQIFLDMRNFDKAEELLITVVTKQPDFAEAWNRLAVLHYIQGNYQAAIAECETVLQLNPIHFGALHGLGICHMATANYAAAIKAFRQALEVQPYSLQNQRFLLECTAKLS